MIIKQAYNDDGINLILYVNDVYSYVADMVIILKVTSNQVSGNIFTWLVLESPWSVFKTSSQTVECSHIPVPEQGSVLRVLLIKILYPRAYVLYLFVCRS